MIIWVELFGLITSFWPLASSTYEPYVLPAPIEVHILLLHGTDVWW